MRYQVASGGFVVGSVLIPSGTEINLNRPDHELTMWEQIAKGKTPPATVLSLDADCAIAQIRSYPHLRHRLHRQLHPEAEKLFQRLLTLPEPVLAHCWPRPGQRRVAVPLKAKPKNTHADDLNAAIAARSMVQT